MIHLGHLIGLFYFLHVDGLTTLHECHCGHQLAHGNSIFVPDGLGRLQPRFVANCVDVSEGIVFGAGCPSGHDGRYSVLVIASNVSTQDQECSTQSVFHRDELFKLLVCWVGTFPQPSVPYSDVEGVIVANTPGYNLRHGNTYIAAAPPAPASAAITTRTTSRTTFHQFIFFMFK